MNQNNRPTVLKTIILTTCLLLFSIPTQSMQHVSDLTNACPWVIRNISNLPFSPVNSGTQLISTGPLATGASILTSSTLGTYWLYQKLHGSLDRLKKLRDTAPSKQIGSKALHLMRLQELFENNNKIKIPPFIAIRSDHIKKIAASHGLDIDARWGKISKLTDQNKFDKARQRLEKDVKDTFNKAAQEAKSTKNFSFEQRYSLKAIDEFINGLDKDQMIIARSSGDDEDTGNSSNAGGNLSVPYVTTAPEDILKSCGSVVASYLSDKSWGQRNLLMKNIVDHISTPVIIQEMITETDSKNIIRSGVMFTEDPQSSISQEPRYHKNGTIKTTGITLINATFGANEAVVDDQWGVNVDCFYVMPAATIYPVVTYKPYRLEKKGIGSYKKIRNPSVLTIAPALTLNQLNLLKRVARKLEKSYNRPMDIEFIIKNDILYLVQARPRVYAQQKTLTQKPSYLGSLDQATALYHGSTILGGSGSVLKLEGPANLLIAGSLAEALEVFNLAKNDGERAAIKLIIVANKNGSRPAANSHPAIMFSSLNKPVFFMRDATTVQEALEAQKPLYFSPQQELIAQLDEATICEGRARYQAPHTFSYVPEFAQKPQLVDLAPYKKLMEDLTKTPTVQLWDVARKPSSQDQAKAALLVIFGRVSNLTTSGNENQLRKHIRGLVAHAIQNKLNSRRATQRWLLALEVIQAFLTQRPENNVVQSYSIDSTYSPNEKVEVTLLKLAEIARSEDLQKQITNFITTLKGNELNAFILMVVQLNELGVLAEWTNISLARELTKKHAPETILRSLAQEVQKSALALKRSKEMQTILDGWNPAEWSNSAQFDALFAMLTTTIAPAFGYQQDEKRQEKSEFVTTFKKASALGKLVLLEVMRQFVDKFDQSIKAFIGNPANINDEAAEQFRKMLKVYATTFEEWLKLVNLKDLNLNKRWNWSETRRATLKESLEKFLKVVQNIVGKTFDKKDFSLTTDFNVATHMINGGYNPRNWEEVTNPKSGSDAFTIAHQNYLALLAVLGKKTGLFDFKRPQPLATLETEVITQWKLDKIDTSKLMVGVSLHSPHTTTIFYNLILNNHSMQFEATYYDAHHPIKAWQDTIKITSIFAGDNLVGEVGNIHRWEKLGEYAQLYASVHAKNVKAHITYTENSFTVSFQGKQAAIKDALTYLEATVFGPVGLETKLSQEEALTKIINKLSEQEKISLFDRFYHKYSYGELRGLSEAFTKPLLSENAFSFFKERGDNWEGYTNFNTRQTIFRLHIDHYNLERLTTFLDKYHAGWDNNDEILKLLWEELWTQSTLYEDYAKNPKHKLFTALIKRYRHDFINEFTSATYQTSYKKALTIEIWKNTLDKLQPGWQKNKEFLKDLWKKHSYVITQALQKDHNLFLRKLLLDALGGAKPIIKQLYDFWIDRTMGYIFYDDLDMSLLDSFDQNWKPIVIEKLKSKWSYLNKFLSDSFNHRNPLDNPSLTLVLEAIPDTLLNACIQYKNDDLALTLLNKLKPNWQQDALFLAETCAGLSFWEKKKPCYDLWKPFLTVGLEALIKTDYQKQWSRIRNLSNFPADWLQKQGTKDTHLVEITNELVKQKGKEATLKLLKELKDCPFGKAAVEYLQKT